MKKRIVIEWLDEPEEHDYPAAKAYLSLMFDDRTVSNFVTQLRQAPVTEFKAKDIFRASGLPLLGISNAHVEKDRKKVLQGKRLSPLLLVRNSGMAKVIIADGYHRLCALYMFDEDALIPCKIA
ncbi:MAG: hypothetical protein HY017_09525 [Betaproteobacteria bacterium]|nr:hypothetical protein [Betaproteobacteria bacterium]